MEWGKKLLDFTIGLLLYCPATDRDSVPKEANDRPQYSLAHLTPEMQRHWLTTVIIILYKVRKKITDKDKGILYASFPSTTGLPPSKIPTTRDHLLAIWSSKFCGSSTSRSTRSRIRLIVAQRPSSRSRRRRRRSRSLSLSVDVVCLATPQTKDVGVLLHWAPWES